MCGKDQAPLSIFLRLHLLLYHSIDNIDVMAPYAAVAADKPRNWHGTSIMARTDIPLKLPPFSSVTAVLE